MKVSIKEWSDVFTKKKTCDYCGIKKQRIMYAVVRPMYKWVDGKPIICGINVAKKCMKCIEEASR